MSTAETSGTPETSETSETSVLPAPAEPAEIIGRAQGYLAELLGGEPAAFDPRTDFDHLGVDSAVAVSLLSEIEGRYGVDLPPESLFENPTLAAVADAVAAQLAPAAS